MYRKPNSFFRVDIVPSALVHGPFLFSVSLFLSLRMASGTPEECVKSGIVLACDQTNGTIDIRYDDAHVESGLLVGSSFQDGDVFRLTDTYLLNAERAVRHI